MGTGICVCVWFLKNLTHFCHVLVHQNSKGGGSVKNVLTRNFVTVPDSLGLLPLPQAPAEEPQSPSVPGSLLPTPHSPPIHLLIYLSIHPPIHPSIHPSLLPLLPSAEWENQRKQLDTPRDPEQGARSPISGLT